MNTINNTDKKAIRKIQSVLMDIDSHTFSKGYNVSVFKKLGLIKTWECLSPGKCQQCKAYGIRVYHTVLTDKGRQYLNVLI